jgi:hypothetical protein
MKGHAPGSLAAFLLLSACGGDRDDATSTAADELDSISSSGDMTTTSGDDMTSTSSSSSSTASSTEDETDGGIKFDMAPIPDGEDTGPPVDMCKVLDEMNAVGDCRETAPPDAFEPDVQWDWWGPNGEQESLVPPLVANLTDDDQNGEIDLCDVPDIVVVATAFPNTAHIYVLDGATGTLHFQIPTVVSWSITPAIGDIDDDGLPEIVAAIGPGFGGPSYMIAFEHDGAVKWTSNAPWLHSQGGSIALADLDNDGDVEIMGDTIVLDHLGATVFVAPAQVNPPQNTAVTAADLDGDGDLEIVLGQSAYHHTGALVYANASVTAGFPQVGNLDADPQPEILVSSDSGVTVLEHDGTIKYLNAQPGGTFPAFRPAAIHDFDGDDVAEFAVSSSSVYSIYETTPSVLWSAPVTDASGWSGGTAFDFDGDGVAEAMYGDEENLYVFDGMGIPLLSVPRSSKTLAEYPIVADVDNDGSAEIIVVSDSGWNGQTAPTVQVIRDVEDRWIQARRIWNQHTYHVTNVREDSTIPQFEPPNWETLNTFRTNAQIEGGGICDPEPVG